MRQHGSCVSVVCPKGTEPDEATFEMVDGIAIYRYWQPWQGRDVLSYLLEYGWAMVCTFLIVSWIWIREDFDVLHAANPPDLFWLVALPFVTVGKQFVYDEHDLCPELLMSRIGEEAALRRLYLFLERCSYWLADLVIVTNRSAYESALARGADPERTCVVRNGPDLGYFAEAEPRPELKGGARFLALYVGTMGPQDGADRILQAVQHIVYTRGRRDVKFALVGNGECVADLRVMASTLQIEPYVDFCGWVDGSELFTYLSTADVCLSPEPPVEFNQRSSFIKLTEYMRYGKVTVSFDLLESRRTLGSSGIFVDEDDTALFGDSVLSILGAPKLRRELGEIAADRLGKFFHWGPCSKVLLNAYDRVIWNKEPLHANESGLAGSSAYQSQRFDDLVRNV
jgi:glycosyltransferase involved in cell wall biosynthesis